MSPDSQAGASPVDAASQRAAVNIRNRRRACGLTTRALSDRLNDLGHRIAHSSISKIEAGDRKVDVDDLAALAAALDVADPWTLVTGDWCPACNGLPPAGFTCNRCGLLNEAPTRRNP